MLLGDPTNSMSKRIGDFVEYFFNTNYIDKHIHSFLKPPQSPFTLITFSNHFKYLLSIGMASLGSLMI